MPALLGGLRLLIVDDEPDARELLAAVLTQWARASQVVASADEALGASRRERPHVLVSDIGMPGEDGYALMRRLRAARATAARACRRWR